VLVYEGVGLLLVVALWIFCLVDVIVSKEDECRNLPKLLWLLIVLMVPDVGSVLWLIAGRPRGVLQSWQQRTRPTPGTRTAPRTTMRSPGANPDDDDEFLRSIRRTDE
jgi:Phospholipase_D-nuclease N-terminal